MNQLDFFYADLKKKFTVDKDKLLDEINPYLKISLETGPAEKYKNLYALDHNVTYYTDNEQIVNGEIKGYSVLSLTETNLKYSTFGFNSLRKHMTNYQWRWKNNLEYTKSIVDQMPFLNYFIVKLISLPAGGLGVMHCDTDEFINHSITLELASSAQDKMKIYYKNKLFETTSDYFIFDDTVLHGTGPVNSDRVILRIFGELDPDALQETIIRETAKYF